MMNRHAHLVGSVPADNAEQAMTLAADLLGPSLLTLPDGETGERRNWIVSMVEGLREHPDLELARDGHWRSYDDTPRFRVRRGHHLFGANLDLGIAESAIASRGAFERVRASLGRPEMLQQVGIPGDLDLAMFSFGPAGALRQRGAFTEALVGQMRRTREAIGDDVVFQVELPAELVALAKAPGPTRPGLARVLARGVTTLASGAPAGSRFGLHLCLGDMNNQAFGTMGDVAPLVNLANALVRGWPDGRPLDYVHAPLGAADHPAPTEPAFYRPLAELSLPARTRFVAGFAHEGQSLSDQTRIRDTVERLVGHPVDVAAACGLGRRDAATGRANLERTAALL